MESNRTNKMEKFEKIKSLIADMEADADKFYTKTNSAAGTRLRSAYQQLKVIAQEARVEITEIKNNRKGDS